MTTRTRNDIIGHVIYELIENLSNLQRIEYFKMFQQNIKNFIRKIIILLDNENVRDETKN